MTRRSATTPFAAELRPYQKEAVGLVLARGNLLLAMTMGSGKTAVAITAIEAMAVDGRVRAGAVFVQNSTKFQWVREVEKWGGGSAQVIDGPKEKRIEQYRSAHKYRYTILNYDALIHDWEWITEYLPIDFVIADEVTNIKSFKAKRSRRLKSVGRCSPIRLGMSGQPVENRPEELFSIMEFVDADVLGSFEKFDRTFVSRDHWGRPKRYRNLPLLKKTLSDAMFRRNREDIAEYLPKVLSVALPAPLDAASMELYDYVRTDLLEVIAVAVSLGMGGFDLMAHYGHGDSAESNKLKGEIMSRITTMRLLCDHPNLLRHSADDFDDPETRTGSTYASLLKQMGKLDALPQTSDKLDALYEQVAEILSENDTNKVVIFSGFKPIIAMMQAKYKGSVVITGDVKPKDRDIAIVRFNTDINTRIFLSSDAGAYGVNLDGGSHLINYDLPWSAGAYAQRQSRIDRLSSVHRQIYVASMFATGTIEERQYEMLQQKQSISAAFLDGKYDPKGTLTLTLNSLREFLAA
jgi:SNF2 family DNA or RNA helicase